MKYILTNWKTTLTGLVLLAIGAFSLLKHGPTMEAVTLITGAVPLILARDPEQPTPPPINP